MIQYRKHEGPLIKPCPCSPETVSCGYFNLNLHQGCPYDCSYCILQSYLQDKSPVFFTNINDVKDELEALSAKYRRIRIGTGELSDSLAFDDKTGYSLKIISIFEMFPRVVFEFKTKSVKIENLLAQEKVLPNLVISWSLNPAELATGEESGAPPVKDRLAAMNRVLKKGYKIGIHLDPIIFVNDWKSLYSEIVREIASTVDPGKVAWMSLGALRFPYSLREYIFNNSGSRLFHGELIKGYDGKYRYFKPQRMDLFLFIARQIKTQISNDVALYLCMEDSEAWEEVFPEYSADTADINRRLYDSVLGR